ncbi:hypothetical protein, partial [Klebsiella pneumoniae]
TLWIAGPSMVGDFHPLISNRSPGAHCFYNQYSNIVFFQIQAERELIKWLLLPVRGTSFTVFENSQCF